MPDPAPKFDRNHCLRMSDDALIDQCDVDTYRASGPGGQKRNKTSSAVRLRHWPTGLLAIAEESRSQHENKARAVRRLRLLIALEIRQPIQTDAPVPELAKVRTPDGALVISQKNPSYPIVAAVALDALAATGAAMRDAAALLGVTTAQLSRFFTEDGRLLAAANALRRQHGHRPLTGAS